MLQESKAEPARQTTSAQSASSSNEAKDSGKASSAPAEKQAPVHPFFEFMKLFAQPEVR
jgi:hypothetical protein